MKEFDEWVDAQIGARVRSDGNIDRETVMLIVREAIKEISRAEEMLKTQAEYQAAVGMAEQVRTAYDEIVEKIRDCCGMDAGDRFCEAFGCGTLKRIGVQLRAALPREEKER